MNLDDRTIELIAAAVAARLKRATAPPGWPEARGCINEAEFSRWAGIGQDFARELRARHEIEFTQVGRRILFSPAQGWSFLERFQKNGQTDKTNKNAAANV